MSTAFRSLVLVAGVALCLGGCAGSSRYVSPDETTQMGAEFSDTDFRMMANEMADSMVRSPAVGGRETPARIALLTIENKTTDYIDTDAIADKIILAMMRTGKAQMVDRAVLKDIQKELKLSESGFVDPQYYKSFGKAASADMLLTGELSSIEKREGRKTLIWYRLSLRLVELETTVVVWMDEKEIKKESMRGVFGL